MGTRGALVLIGNENVRTMYNHFDSYPDGLGMDALQWLRSILEHGVEGEERARLAVSRLMSVPDRPPTEEDRRRLAAFMDDRVSTGRDWYALLRKTQGDIRLTLDAGLYEPADEFPLDSLFCEWAYVVDFDARVFEVYEGFNHGPATEGRWAGQDGTTSGYGPVQRRARYSFDALPIHLPSFDEEDLVAVGQAADGSPLAIATDGSVKAIEG